MKKLILMFGVILLLTSCDFSSKLIETRNDTHLAKSIAIEVERTLATDISEPTEIEFSSFQIWNLLSSQAEFCTEYREKYDAYVDKLKGTGVGHTNYIHPLYFEKTSVEERLKYYMVKVEYSAVFGNDKVRKDSNHWFMVEVKSRPINDRGVLIFDVSAQNGSSKNFETILSEKKLNKLLMGILNNE